MISFDLRRDGATIRLVRRSFHGVERPEYTDLATLSLDDARNLHRDFGVEIAAAERYVAEVDDRALAAARERRDAAIAEVEALEAKIAARPR